MLEQRLRDTLNCIHWASLEAQTGEKSACCARSPASVPIPSSGRSLGEGHGNPLQYSCLGNPIDRGAWWDTLHGVAKEWDTTEQLTLPLFMVGGKAGVLGWQSLWSHRPRFGFSALSPSWNLFLKKRLCFFIFALAPTNDGVLYSRTPGSKCRRDEIAGK